MLVIKMTTQTKISFPGDNMSSEIPVFLTCFWGDYSRYNKDRTKSSIISKGNYIQVPYPKLFNVSNDVPYTNSGTISGGPMDNLKTAFDNLTFEGNQLVNYFLKGGSSFTYDNMESVLTPGARRKYIVGMDLIAKTEAQAEKAKLIADTFQKNAFSTWEGGNRLIWKHPPLWVLSTTTTQNNTTNSKGWDPTGLPSVLTHVDINKNPILDTPFNLSNDHPLAININLSFVELEPAVNTKAYGLTNRAQTFGG